MRISIVFAFIIVVVFACGGEKSADGSKNASIGNGEKQSQVDQLAIGKKAFKQFCVACHGMDGKLGVNGAKDFAQSDLNLKERIEVITNGRGMMTPFKGVLKPEQIKAAAEYTIHLGKQTEE
ncbi:MAG: cytochrome c [Saprospiraceae bacterium]